MTKKKTPKDEGFGLQKPEEPKSAPSPVATKQSAPATQAGRAAEPQSNQPNSVFPPLQVSGLGTQARGQFRERLGFNRSPRVKDSHMIVLVPEELRSQLGEQHCDLRERLRSPLV